MYLFIEAKSKNFQNVPKHVQKIEHTIDEFLKN